MTPAKPTPHSLEQRANRRLRICRIYCRFAVVVVLLSTVGCARLTRKEDIIRVQAFRNPTEAARLTLLGVKALDHAEIDRAIARFIDAVDADETYGPAHNNLGLLYYEQGDLYQAALAFERAMELMPQDPAVYYNLGLTLESAGKVFEAMDLYSQAVEMDPVNPNFLGNLVRLRVRLGENDPTLVTQLQDLILIETRPEWRHWADRQLALALNPMLDRGPETPEFDAGERGDSSIDEEALLRSKIIELTPEIEDGIDRRMLTPPQSKSSDRSRAPSRLTGPDQSGLDQSGPVQSDTDQSGPTRDGPIRIVPDQSDPMDLPSELPPQQGSEPLSPPPGNARIGKPRSILDDGSLGSLPPSILQVGAETTMSLSDAP